MLLSCQLVSQARVETDKSIIVGPVPFFESPTIGAIQYSQNRFLAYDGFVWKSLQAHNYGVVYDVDGYAYRTVQIGDQIWMADNLKVTRFNDASPLEESLSRIDFQSTGDEKKAAWTYSNYNTSHLESFGRIYNGYVIKADKNICPVGWKVPNIDDWNILFLYLRSTNSSDMAGTGILRSTGTRSEQSGLWEHSSYSATNAFKFNLEPAGYIDDQGFMINQYIGAYLWTGDIHETAGFDMRVTNTTDSFIYQGSIPKESGRSIRCFKK